MSNIANKNMILSDTLGSRNLFWVWVSLSIRFTSCPKYFLAPFAPYCLAQHSHSTNLDRCETKHSQQSEHIKFYYIIFVLSSCNLWFWTEIYYQKQFYFVKIEEYFCQWMIDNHQESLIVFFHSFFGTFPHLLNPHTGDRFTPSHARCAENCGSALTHR